MGQTINVDWSSVSVGADGATHAAFGPRLRTGEPPLDGSAMLGYFANSDGFYGRPLWTEYQELRHDAAEDRLEALKVVGDANVPRGQLTFRTAPGEFSAPTAQMAIQLRLRDDPSDPDGFEWSPGEHSLRWVLPAVANLEECHGGGGAAGEQGAHEGGEDGGSPAANYYCGFHIAGPNPSGGQLAHFYRVSEQTASVAARAYVDAP